MSNAIKTNVRVVGRVREDDLALRNALRLAAPGKVGLRALGVAHLEVLFDLCEVENRDR